jgi:hypothetical protein
MQISQLSSNPFLDLSTKGSSTISSPRSTSTTDTQFEDVLSSLTSGSSPLEISSPQSNNLNSMTTGQLLEGAQNMGLGSVTSYLETSSIHVDGSPVTISELTSDTTVHDFPKELAETAAFDASNGDQSGAAYFNSLNEILSAKADGQGNLLIPG